MKFKSLEIVLKLSNLKFYLSGYSESKGRKPHTTPGFSAAEYHNNNFCN